MARACAIGLMFMAALYVYPGEAQTRTEIHENLVELAVEMQAAFECSHWAVRMGLEDQTRLFDVGYQAGIEFGAVVREEDFDVLAALGFKDMPGLTLTQISSSPSIEFGLGRVYQTAISNATAKMADGIGVVPTDVSLQRPLAEIQFRKAQCESLGRGDD